MKLGAETTKKKKSFMTPKSNNHVVRTIHGATVECQVEKGPSP